MLRDAAGAGVRRTPATQPESISTIGLKSAPARTTVVFIPCPSKRGAGDMLLAVASRESGELFVGGEGEEVDELVAGDELVEDGGGAVEGAGVVLLVAELGAELG